MTAPAALPDVDAMEAGPEMDALIAETVLGWTPNAKHPNIRGDGWWSMPNGGETGYSSVLPPFSTDDAAALEVMRKIPRPPYADSFFAIFYSPDGKPQPSRLPIWEAGWQEPDEDGPDFIPTYSARADTLALAICRAALLATRAALTR